MWKPLAAKVRRNLGPSPRHLGKSPEKPLRKPWSSEEPVLTSRSLEVPGQPGICLRRRRSAEGVVVVRVVSAQVLRDPGNLQTSTFLAACISEVVEPVELSFLEHIHPLSGSTANATKKLTFHAVAFQSAV
jgi:hypothetical protein